MPYDAFISYSHSSDADVAPAIRNGLQRLAKPWNRRRALNVFLDQSSLEVAATLKDALQDRLRDARWLIVLLSAESSRSPWVNEELREWVATKSRTEIALVVTSGEVVWDKQARDFDWQMSTAVPEALRGVYAGEESEPLYLDLRWVRNGEPAPDLTLNSPRFRDAIATLAAPIHGLPKDDLEGEDLRQHRRALRLRRAAVAGLVVLTAAASVAAVLALMQRATAIRERDESEARRLAALAEANAAEQTDHALLLALASRAVTPTEEGTGALFVGLSREVLARAPLEAHDGGVHGLAFSADGSRLASVGEDGSVLLWDPVTGERIGEPLLGHDVGLRAVDLSPDGSLVASAGGDETVRLWDASTGSPVGAPLLGHEDTIFDLAFNHDGSLLASASFDGTVALWDVATRTRPSVLPGHEGWVLAVEFAGDDIVSVADDGLLRIWDVATGTLVRSRPVTSAEMGAAAFNHDGSRLAVAGLEGDVELVDVATFRTTRLQAEGRVLALAFSPDDTLLATGGSGRRIQLWATEDGREVMDPLAGHDGAIFAIEFAPDGFQLVSGATDTTVRRWDLHNAAAVGTVLPGAGDGVRALAASPATGVVGAGYDGTVINWSAELGKAPSVVPYPDAAEPFDVAVNQAGAVAAGGTDGVVHIWPPGGAATPLALTGHEDWVFDVAFDQEGAQLASSSDDGTIRVWDARTGQERHAVFLGVDEVAFHLRFNPDSSRVAGALGDGTAVIWEVGTNRVPLRLDHSAPVIALVFAAGGTELLTATAEGDIVRWSVPTGATLGAVVSQAGDWSAGAFNEDGSVLAVAGDDAGIRLWDLGSGESVLGRPLTGHLDEVTSVVFGGDGSWLVSASGDETVRLWPMPDRWADLACQAVGRDLTPEEWQRLIGGIYEYRTHCA